MVSVPQEELPQPITPVPDRSVEARTNLAYRGNNYHGVRPDAAFSDVPVHDTVEVEYEPPVEEPDPIPVKIVSTGGDEIKRMRVTREYTGLGATRMVAPLNRARTALRIRNLDGAKIVYVGDEASSAIPSNGYPIPPGTEWTSTTQMEVYAQCEDAAVNAQLAVMQEYASEV